MKCVACLYFCIQTTSSSLVVNECDTIVIVVSCVRLLVLRLKLESYITISLFTVYTFTVPPCLLYFFFV